MAEMRRRPARSGLWAGPLGALALLSPGGASADLRDDARRLESSWAEAGLKVERLAPIFIEQGRQRGVRAGAAEGDCVSVAALGPRGVEFAVRPEGEAEGERSKVGIFYATRCGPSKDKLLRLSVEMKSARAAIEVLVASGFVPAPDPVGALIERATRPARPQLDPGRAPGSEALAARAARAEGRARAEGAVDVQALPLDANEEGTGRQLLPFREGCHRVEVIADHGVGGRQGDVDADLKEPRTDALIARDRSETPDARLEFCVGEPEAMALLYRGAPSRAKVVVSLSRWALPDSVPSLWGSRARGAMAMQLWRRRLAPPRGTPVLALTGVGGATQLSAELSPGACYLLLVGLLRGEAKGLTLSGVLEGRFLRDEGGHGRNGLSLSFCSDYGGRLPLSLEARGANLVWGAALYHQGPP